MENKQIQREIDNECINESDLLDIPNSSPIEGENILKDAKNNNLANKKTKREELESIQADLDDLVLRLNSFIGESQDVSSDAASEGDEDSSTISEKQDGPSEKELNLLISDDSSYVNNLYLSDGSRIGDINWDNAGPILQKHVADLQKLHSLNQITNAVVRRLKNVTEVKGSFIEETTQKLDE